MPVGGIVITVYPDEHQRTEMALGRFAHLTVYGSDENGNIIAMVKGDDAVSVEEVIRDIEGLESVRGVNLAYLKDGDTPDLPA